MMVREGFHRAPTAIGLSPREYEVARLAACGLTLRETADRLGISDSTAKNYRTAILARLRVERMIEAFIALGWLTVPAE